MTAETLTRPTDEPCCVNHGNNHNPMCSSPTCELRVKPSGDPIDPDCCGPFCDLDLAELPHHYECHSRLVVWRAYQRHRAKHPAGDTHQTNGGTQNG